MIHFSSIQKISVSRDLRFPIFSELYATKDLFVQEVKNGRMDPSELEETELLIDSFCREVFLNTQDAPLPRTSTLTAITALKEQREKLEALAMAADELKKAMGI